MSNERHTQRNEAIVRLYRERVPLPQIARRFGMQQGNVTILLRARGLCLPRVIGHTETLLLALILQQADRGRVPSVIEMGRMLGVSKGRISQCLDVLMGHGLISCEPGLARTIRPTCRMALFTEAKP